VQTDESRFSATLLDMQVHRAFAVAEPAMSTDSSVYSMALRVSEPFINFADVCSSQGLEGFKAWQASRPDGIA